MSMKNLRYNVLWVFASVIFIGFIHSDVSAAPDSLTFIGHASVKIKTSEGKIIYIDPYAGTAADYSDSADIVLITHQHYDHNNLSLIKRKTGCVVFTNAEAIVGGVYQSVTVGTVKIDGVAAYNANHPKSTSVGFVVEFDGIRLYHTGDTGKIDEMAELAARTITYALLCMDGIYNMTPEAATEAAAMIQAQHDIPIHTMPPPDTYNEAIVARFTPPNKLVIRNGESIELSSGSTSVGSAHNRPSSFFLGQNYPNPFNPSTKIDYTIPTSGFVSVKIYNAIGQEVASLVNSTQPAGTYSVEWQANDFPSGVYFYRIETGECAATKKLILLR
jgi:L-ascorbate metabolism protein UlaG (beta-lactamase superfamily)